MDNSELQIKKILYRAVHRGCKETDFLLGNFFVANKSALKNFELDLCEKFLSEDDMLIYDWIIGKTQLPTQSSTQLLPQLQTKFPIEYQKLIDAIRAFHKI